MERFLAHSHSWKGEKSKPLDNFIPKFEGCECRLAKHPREMADLICVADLVALRADRMSYMPVPAGLHLKKDCDEEQAMAWQPSSRRRVLTFIGQRPQAIWGYLGLRPSRSESSSAFCCVCSHGKTRRCDTRGLFQDDRDGGMRDWLDADMVVKSILGTSSA